MGWGSQKEDQFGDGCGGWGSKFKLDNSKFGQTKFHQLAHPKEKDATSRVFKMKVSFRTFVFLLCKILVELDSTLVFDQCE